MLPCPVLRLPTPPACSLRCPFPLLLQRASRSGSSASRAGTRRPYRATCPSDDSTFDFQLSAACPERRRLNSLPVSPFLATLTDFSQLIENTGLLSPLFATLTSYVARNSFVCHSYRKVPGVVPPPNHLPPPSTLHSPSAHTEQYPQPLSAQTLTANLLYTPGVGVFIHEGRTPRVSRRVVANQWKVRTARAC